MSLPAACIAFFARENVRVLTKIPYARRAMHVDQQKSLHGGSERKTLASAFEIPSTILGPECGSGVDEGTDYTIPPIRSPVYDTIRNQPRTGSVVLVAEHGMMLCGDLIYYYLCKSNTFLLIVNSIRFECR